MDAPVISMTPGAMAGSGTSASPTSPTSVRTLTGLNGGPSPKRKRASIVAAEIIPHGGHMSSADSVKMEPSSPLGSGAEDDGDRERKRQPGVKRACNECRQQKLRCDVIQDPFVGCSRCNRLKLDCKIESNFKRVGKRSKHAEMEKEIEKLRRNISQAREQGYVMEEDDLQSPVATSFHTHTRNPSLMGSDDVVSSLLHLKRGGSSFITRFHELENVRLTDEMVSQLFGDFFAFYHRFLPFLNPAQTPDQYYQQHPLLFWSIIAVAARRYGPDPNLLSAVSDPLTRLLWKTIGDVPTSHYVVKALCILCSWPLPTSTSTSDPTQILCGVMMKIATSIGLHRPRHTQDFSRVSVELNKEQLHDRVTTWAVANIVAQSVGTGYGQPASTLYDWTLAVRPEGDDPFALSAELDARLRIERFCDKISKEMYSNASDPRGVAGDEHRAMLMRVFRREYNEIQAELLSQNHSHSPIVLMHLRAAALHLRLAGFFDSSNTIGYMDDLVGLWRATCAFLEDGLLASEPSSPHDNIGSSVLRYCTNYLGQMLVAAGFSLLKLLRSFFAKSIDYERGRQLFHRTIQAIRTTSVVNQDLNWRLAEVMVQMWNGARIDPSNYTNDDERVPADDSLQLKVRCRHSMSHVFDSIWRWREEYQAQGRGTLDALKQPTNPDSAAESSASSTTHPDTTMLQAPGLQANLLAASNGALTPGVTPMGGPAGAAILGVPAAAYGGEPNYDFFDPQHWMLDGLLDFNYNNYVQPLEGA